MTPKEIKSLIKALRDAGVTYYKTADIELNLAPVPKEEPRAITPVDAPSAAEDPIKHKVEEMVSLLKLSDTELVDQLFPEPREEEAS